MFTNKITTPVSHSFLNEKERSKIFPILCEKLGTTKEISKGCYAKVFEHPNDSNKVIKIAIDDVWYTTYLKWVIHHQDNPYVPKIFSVEFVRRVGSKSMEWKRAVIVVMEKLSPEDFSEGDKSYGVRDYLKYGHEEDNFDPKGKLGKYLIQFRRFMMKHSRHHDLHVNNAMYRDRQIVITDPLA